ncbi:hypothetical protein L7F22_058368 [Adiantum nelumboides]|nr:hypothetical protein [Adiantum nelumboides]
MYAKVGYIDEAKELFDKLWQRDVFSWNSLISGYAERGTYHQAPLCFDEMQAKGVPPNSSSSTSALKCCGNYGAISKGQEIHMEITSKGLEESQAIGNNLITMNNNFSLLSEAQTIFKTLVGQDVTWTAIVRNI